ncbi:hypothetical protein M0805_007880 [Coniferiporia weirii]|nr:hypothetical protein M0805_007880 [Coniferiporia weirii]
MVALALPVFLETLDYTVVATAQPHIASAFNRLDLQSYVGTLYLLTSTVFLPLFASFADVYGRHWSMQLSILLFLIGSALSTAAQNMPMMLAGRGVSGIGAAGFLTVVRIILADSTSLNDNNFQSSVLTSLYALGYCLGPFIGGALTDISFRWIFAINLPCCVVAIALVFFLLPLFTSGGILLLLGLNWGSNEGWGDVKVIVSLVVGALVVCATIGWEAILEHKRERYSSEGGFTGAYASEAEKMRRMSLPAPLRASALLPLAVLRNYDVLATSLAPFTSGMVMIVIFYFVALFMVIVSGKNPIQAGTQLIYFAPGMGIGTIVAITMIKHLRQPKYPIILGSTIIPIGLGLISSAINKNQKGTVNGFMILIGSGVGMTFGPLAIHVRFSQPNSRVAIVIALNLFFRALGGTVGLAQCGAVMNAKVRSYFASLSASSLAELQGSGASSLSAADITSLDQINALPSDVQVLVRNAFHNGVRWSFISLVPWACISLVARLFLRPLANMDEYAPVKKGATPGHVPLASTQHESHESLELEPRRA